MFEAYTRDQLRQAYCAAWAKRLAGAPLMPLEAMIADVIGLHPEYQTMLGAADRALLIEPDTTHATENPFLHMGLHLAIREQLSIDRPPGICHLERQLQALYVDPHAAEHILMEALAETLWEAQRAGRPPDETQYLARVQRRLTHPAKA